MKKRLLLGTVICSLLVVLFSCSHEIGVGPDTKETVVEAKGSISGTVRYSNAEKDQNGGIMITLDKTDGLNTIAVTKSAVSRSIVDSARTVVSSSYTSQDGTYSFSNLEPGTYTVYASSASSKEKAVKTNAVVKADENTVVDPLNLTATGSITGTITTDWQYYGNTGYLVFIAGTSYMAMTDDAGNYTISDVPAGNYYQIVATKNNVIHFIDNVYVYANSSTGVMNNNFASSEVETVVQGEKGDKGDNGEDGKDGLGIVWRGAFDFDSEISDPKYLDAYFNKTDGCSYIYDGTKWTLLAKAGDDGVDRGNNSSEGYNQRTLAVGTVLSTEKPTNEPVVITVNLTKAGLEKKGYVYSVENPSFENPLSVLDSSDFIPLVKDLDGKYKITASENGFYTVAVKDNEDCFAYTQEQITNIDKIPPSEVTDLRARYDINKELITVIWTNPDEADFAYVDISYRKGSVLHAENENILDGNYSISNVRVDGSTYEFLVCAVDEAGNKSKISTVSITPKPYSIGDVLLNDGTIVPCDSDFSYEDKQKAIAVLYEIVGGKPKGWLGKYNSVSITADGYLWERFKGINANQNFYGITARATLKGNGGIIDHYKEPFSGDLDGSDNLQYILLNGGSISDFPAFSYANNYASNHNLTGEYSSGWYLPSLAELYTIYKNISVLNSSLRKINGTQLAYRKYWTSSQVSKNGEYALNEIWAWLIDLDDGDVLQAQKSNQYCSVCCVWTSR